MVHCWNMDNETPDGIGNPPDGDPLPGLDWEMWLGPPPKRRYNPNRCLYNFRWFWDYAGGKVADWGVHLLDIALWAMGEHTPESVTAMGGKFALHDNRETPDTVECLWRSKDLGPGLCPPCRERLSAERARVRYNVFWDERQPLRRLR